jgi:aminopeptidase-like protein
MHLASSYALIVSVLDVLERNCWPLSANPKGEPHLGRRGLYGSLGGHKQTPHDAMALLWVMNLADGRHALLDMAERAHLPFDVIADAADLLHDARLLSRQAGAAGRL